MIRKSGLTLLGLLMASAIAMPAAAGSDKAGGKAKHDRPAAAQKHDKPAAAQKHNSGSGSATSVGTGAATGDSATGGTGGSAAAGGTSASTLGLAGTSTGEDGETASVLGTGGTAATVEGRATSRTKVVENPNMIQGQSRAQAMDQGTFSKAHTKTRVRHGEEIDSRTKTMSHVPGEKAEMSTTTEQVEVQ